MIKVLPTWCLVSKFPAFYDTESLTAIEQTARLYGKMNELIETYNKFANEVNEDINSYHESVTKENEVYRVAMRQEFQDFIDKIDLKVKGMQRDIDKAVEYMKDNLSVAVQDAVATMVANGEITITTIYDEATEDITIAVQKGE